jgi:D-xylulose reductase
MTEHWVVIISYPPIWLILFLKMPLLKTEQWQEYYFCISFKLTLHGFKIEPLAVGVHSVANLGGLRANQAIAIFGCGPVGLLCMAVAKALGASRIIGIDISPSRLEFAKQYAATHTYSPLQPEKGEVEYGRRNAADMKKQLGITERGNGAIDLVIDASGAEASIQTAIYIVKAGGTVVQVRNGLV